MSKRLLVVFLLTIFVLSLSATAVLAQGDGSVYTIQKDDWLSKIAEKEYGDPLAYTAIVYYNNMMAAEDSTLNNIGDADVLEVGWTIYWAVRSTSAPSRAAPSDSAAIDAAA